MAPLRVDVNVGVIMQFVTGVVTRAQSFKHDVLLLTQDDHDGIERVAAGSMVDAVIMMDVEAEDPRLPILRRQRQPAVLIGLPRDATGFSCVDLDFEAAGRAAVTHLAGLGHRQIALIGSPRAVLSRRTTYAARLVRGFTQESARLGLDAVFETCESSHSGAIEAVDQVLAGPAGRHRRHRAQRGRPARGARDAAVPRQGRAPATSPSSPSARRTWPSGRPRP